MANIKLTFYGTKNTHTNLNSLECVKHDEKNIYISITTDKTNVICLDKSTAIKFAKTLRTEINKLKD